MTTLNPAASQCPLCGQSNQCAVVAGLPPEQCWCMTAQLNPQALAQMPEAQRRQACICPACGRMPLSGAASPLVPEVK